MSEPRPFRVEIPQTTINAIMRKVHDYEWHEAPEGSGLAESWAYGTNLAYMEELCRYWLDVYDWRKW